MNESKVYAVLFQYSPNGRNDKGEFSAAVEGGRFYRSRGEACAAVKAKWEDLMERERTAGFELDPEWAEKLTEEEMREMGYSVEPDFSKLSFEYESKHADVLPEPKYSWTVVELACPAAAQ